jgi:hypothetical protein
VALTVPQFETLKTNNPTVRLGLFRSTIGVDKNRVIIYGLSSSVTSKTIVGTGLNLTGIEWQKAIYRHSKDLPRYYTKPIAVTLV